MVDGLPPDLSEHLNRYLSETFVAEPRAPYPSASPDRLFVDSSAWIALSARDRHHAEAEALFRAAIGRRARLFTTNLILAEIHRLLLFRAGVQAASTALDRLESSSSLTLTFPSAEHHAAARAWLRRLGPQRLSYADAVGFVVIATSRCQAVLTFDQDFGVAGFRVLCRGD
jgi:predicted nucleic acid-binding protein